jgi:hypothetical protein
MEIRLSAYDVLEEQALQAYKTGDAEAFEETLLRVKDDGVLFWYHLQAFLIASGNLSKLFWPGLKANKGRGEYLREFFNVEENSPLKDRRIRNHFEHFDERLDRWDSAECAKGFADEWVVFPGRPDPLKSGVSPENCLRVFYVSDMCASFYGEKYQLRPVADEIDRIFPKVMSVANDVHVSIQKHFTR